MRHVIATMLDQFKFQRRQNDPNYQAWHLKPEREPASMAHELPHLNMIADPTSHWVDALQCFHSLQLESGFDLMRSGLGPQTAADLQNLQVAQDHRGSTLGSPPYPPPTPVPVHHEPRHVEPWNNPLSTIPGAPFPMKLPGM